MIKFDDNFIAEKADNPNKRILNKISFNIF